MDIFDLTRKISSCAELLDFLKKYFFTNLNPEIPLDFSSNIPIPLCILDALASCRDSKISVGYWLWVPYTCTEGSIEVVSLLVSLLMLSDSLFLKFLAIKVLPLARNHPRILRPLVLFSLGQIPDNLFVIGNGQKLKVDIAEESLKFLMEKEPTYSVSILCPDCPSSLHLDLIKALSKVKIVDLPESLPPPAILPNLLCSTNPHIRKHFEKIAYRGSSSISGRRNLLSCAAFAFGSSEMFLKCSSAWYPMSKHLLLIDWAADVLHILTSRVSVTETFDFGIFHKEKVDKRNHIDAIGEYIATFYQSGRSAGGSNELNAAEYQNFVKAQELAHPAVETLIRGGEMFSSKKWISSLLSALTSWMSANDKRIIDTIKKLLLSLGKLAIRMDAELSTFTRKLLRDLLNSNNLSEEEKTVIKSCIKRDLEEEQVRESKKATLDDRRAKMISQVELDMAKEKKIRGVIALNPFKKPQIKIQETYKPDPLGLEKFVLGVNVDLKTKLIPKTFQDYKEYVETFEPLLFMEAKSQLLDCLEDLKSSGSRGISGKILELTTNSDFVVITIMCKINDFKRLEMADFDIMLIRPKNLQQFFGRVLNIITKNATCEIRLNILKNSLIRLETECILERITSLVTFSREHTALCSISKLPLLSTILSPRPRMSLQNDEEVKRILECQQLNQIQAHAVFSCLSTKGISLIQGPPGTGKTRTIVALLGELLSVHKSILVCAPSNAAVDEICRRALHGLINSSGQKFFPSIIRAGNMDMIHADIRQLSLDEQVLQEIRRTNQQSEQESVESESQLQDLFVGIEQVKRRIEQIHCDLRRTSDDNVLAKMHEALEVAYNQRRELTGRVDMIKKTKKETFNTMERARNIVRKTLLKGANIVACTLSGAGNEQLAKLHFPVAIIDEAAQCVETSCIIPLRLGCESCILVGDPKQLPPTVCSKEAKRMGYEQSLFVRLEKNCPESVFLLEIQYRMHPDISFLPSKLFYNSKLKDGVRNAVAPWYSRFFGAFRFFDLKSEEKFHKSSKSLINMSEVDVIISLIVRLLSENPTTNFANRIGIITPYRQQMITLRTEISRYFGRPSLDVIDINTVDGFQGQEKDIILFSCVRSGSQIGFLSDTRRMNVALTRARFSLWVIGNSEMLRKHNYWKDLVEHASKNHLLMRVDPQPLPKNVPQNL